MKLIIAIICLVIFALILFVSWTNPAFDSIVVFGAVITLQQMLIAVFLTLVVLGGITCIVNPAGIWRAGLWNWFFRDTSPSRSGLFFIRAAGVALLVFVIALALIYLF